MNDELNVDEDRLQKWLGDYDYDFLWAVDILISWGSFWILMKREEESKMMQLLVE